MDEQLRLKIEQAATSMLTDDEICVSLSITPEILEQYYSTVERARVLLKQKLNAKRITDAATQSNQATELVETIPRGKISSRGGYRPGSGRKPGTTNKISAQSLLEAIEVHSGERFEDLLAQGYYESVINRDKQTRIQYEKMFLGKVVADRVSMDVTENAELLEAKKTAFADAIAKLSGITSKAK